MSKKKFYRGVNKLLPKAKFKDCDDYATLLAGWEDTRPIPTEAEIDVAYDSYEIEEASCMIDAKSHEKIEALFPSENGEKAVMWQLICLLVFDSADEDYYPMKRGPAVDILDDPTDYPPLLSTIWDIMNHRKKLIKNLDGVTLLTLDVDAGTMDTVNGGWPT